ncbi:MAG: N-acetyl-gamma-glutamyl-phosphate reductase [Alphaproteobacteria bacterium]|nr:N-acetyl-gamma-glutamyl-phosphate reductase [Alphaproteobacteria bacterium]
MANKDQAKVFIDGEAGTTGLQIRDRLADFDGVEVISIDHEARKDPEARRDMMRQADVIILCLPDDAAREAVALADSLADDGPRIIDASTAHRTAEGWVYGFAELEPQGAQAARIASAQRVANPGCYATGAIALLRPLIESEWFAADFPFTINAVSGYTGGGKSMIADFEAGSAPVFQLYGLGLNHKHLPEVMHHVGLTRQPIFVPSVGNFAQGMLVSVPLHLTMAKTPPTTSDVEELFAAYYRDAPSVHFKTEDEAYESNKLFVDPAKDSDHMDIWLFSGHEAGQAVLIARLDNLGKGAAGAAVQNLRLMLGLSC